MDFFNRSLLDGLNISSKEDDLTLVDLLREKWGLKDKKTVGDLDVLPSLNDSDVINAINTIPLDENFIWLLTLLLLFMIWVTYCIYYHSRLVGFIATIIANNWIIPRYMYPKKIVSKNVKNNSPNPTNDDINPKLEDNSKYEDDCHKHSQPYFHVGSLSVSFISGKIMFRDLCFITPDFTFRAQDGFLIFRWWIPYIPSDVRFIDFSQTASTRLLVLLGGFELHIYNRSQTYRRLEKLFNLPTRLIPDDEDGDEDDDKNQDERTDKDSKSTKDDKTNDEEIEMEFLDSDPLTGNIRTKKKMKPRNNDELILSYLWRDLIPMTKVEISTGRFVFGNQLMPSTLSLTFDEANICYTTKPAISPHDLFTHIIKAKVDRFKIILTPSPKYLGLTDEPPRYMGDGFAVILSKVVDFNYYQDEPGFVSLDLEKVELSTGDFVERITYPNWGLDIKCEKSTDFNYGPWADRQRESLYNFFYPIDYLDQVEAEKPKIGTLRTFEKFEFKLSTLRDSLIDILFVTEEKETLVTHFNIGAGSCLDMSIPWIMKDKNGYVSHIRGSILHLDATTCLNFRALAESETLEFDLKINYPIRWNYHQQWNLNLTGSKSTVDLIFAHKSFFCHLVDDWAGKSKPDLIKFIPYTWKISIILKEFELITLANNYNWIDCSSKHSLKNVQFAIAGDKFEMTFDMPFNEFLPPKVPIVLWIQGESLEAAIHVPESHPARSQIEFLYQSSKLRPMRSTKVMKSENKNFLKASELFPSGKKWRKHSSADQGWINCWSVPITAICIKYTYHPSPVLSSNFGSKTSRPPLHVNFSRDVPTPDREEAILRPMRPESRSGGKNVRPPPDWWAGNLDPDLAEVDVEIGPSIVTLYGLILRILWDIKENYVGEYQNFTDLEVSNSKVRKKTKNKDYASAFASRFSQATFSVLDPKIKNKVSFDERLYRPLSVTVSLTMHEINAHLMKPCTNEDDPVVPVLFLERLTFEMDKKFTDTKLQLLLSPLHVNVTSSDLNVSSDHLKPSSSYSASNSGSMVMSSFQFRGHAMFSELNRPLESETLEYAWLIEVQLGDITGRLDLIHVQQVLSSTKCLISGILSTDPTLVPPVPFQKCLHDVSQLACPESNLQEQKFCPNPEDIKYRMVRMSISSIDATIFEATNTCINVSVVPVKMATCNLHQGINDGLTLVLDKINIRQFITNDHPRTQNTFDTSALAWIEVANIELGPIVVDTSTSSTALKNITTSQHEFLTNHDDRCRRLWFIWRGIQSSKNRRFSRTFSKSSSKQVRKCGCVGHCAFFGSNYNGIDFLEVKKSPNLHLDNISLSSDDYHFGESLLNKGIAIAGFTIPVSSSSRTVQEASPLDETTSADSQSYFSAEEGDIGSMYQSGSRNDIGGSVSTFTFIDTIDGSRNQSITNVLIKFDGDVLISISPPNLNGLKVMVNSLIYTAAVLEKSARLPALSSDESNDNIDRTTDNIDQDDVSSLGSDFVIIVDTDAIPLRPLTTSSVTNVQNRKSKEVLPVEPILPKEPQIDSKVTSFVLRVRNVQLVSRLSGFRLDGQWTQLQLSARHREELKNSRKSSESVLNGRMGQAKISLLEEIATSVDKQLVFKVTVGKSSSNVSTENFGRDSNNLELCVGPIVVDVPEHPVTLHGMVQRSSRLLTNTIQELRSSRQPSRLSTRNGSNLVLGPTTPVTPQPITASPLLPLFNRQQSTNLRASEPRTVNRGLSVVRNSSRTSKAIVAKFAVNLESFQISASLLPSLRAQYKVGSVSSSGKTGPKAKFVLDILEHHLTFDTNVANVSNANLPTEHVAMPPIHVHAEQVESQESSYVQLRNGPSSPGSSSSYLNVRVDIDSFEHSLTTELLNHLLVVQNVLVKEVNEVLQKMSGSDSSSSAIIEDPRSTPDPTVDSSLIHSSSSSDAVLFKFDLKLSGIRITATTPTKSAVRLEMGSLDVQLSNRGQAIPIIINSDTSIVQFSIVVNGITIGATLLPTLRAQYKIGEVTSTGTTGSKAKFIIDVPEHHLSFDSNDETVDSKLPTSANVALPAIHVSAEYLEDNPRSGSNPNREFDDGIVLRKGSYLNALAEIDFFEHSLTTDLLNHLLLVQKVLMKEVNEVLQHTMSQEAANRNSGAKADAASSSKSSKTIGQSSKSPSYVLFTLDLHLQGIQITATTPTNNAVRFETGPIELQLSNRVQNMSIGTSGSDKYSLKLFVKLQLDLNVSLGQLFRNPIFDEAEPEYQQLAYFKTRIVTRNALQDELVINQNQNSSNQDEDKEAVLITLRRPLIYIQPLALDKAVLVWLNYKNAYDYWSEQRAALAKDVLLSSSSSPTPANQSSSSSSFNNPNSQTLFLQLTVDDLGICLPITNNYQMGATATLGSRISYDSELKSALVITLESTRISACSCGPLVSKAKFNGFCLRFADDFETSLDDWKPDPNDSSVMNVCVVSEGTYEICSRTTTSGTSHNLNPNPTSFGPSSNSNPSSKNSNPDPDAKWFLNVSWKMEGFDIHVDTSIGRQLSALFATLTALAGDEDMDTLDDSYTSVSGEFLFAQIEHNVNQEPEITKSSKLEQEEKKEAELVQVRRPSSFLKEILPGDNNKRRSRLIEKELNEQAAIINGLRLQGADRTRIDAEVKKLNELESAVFNDFKRDVIKKLRRQSSKSSSASFRERSFTTARDQFHRGTFSRMPSLASPDHTESSSLDFNKTVLAAIKQESFGSEAATTDSGSEANIRNAESDITLAASPATESSKNMSSIIRRPESAKERRPLTPLTSESASGSDPYLLKCGLSCSSPSTPGSFPELERDNVSKEVLEPKSPTISTTANTNVDTSSSSSPILIPRLSTAQNTQNGHGSGSSSAGGVTTQQMASHSIQEPNVDFELDVMIYFNSGKCVFHTRENNDENNTKSNRGMVKDRSFIGNLLDTATAATSNVPSPKTVQPRYVTRPSVGSLPKTLSAGGLKSNVSSSKLRYSGITVSQHPAEVTVFLIPGLDIKVHYNSKNVAPNEISNPSGAPSGGVLKHCGLSKDLEFHSNPIMTNLPIKKMIATKKAACFAWMTLHSIPEETVITPHILDFLEQALEPIPIETAATLAGNNGNMNTPSNENAESQNVNLNPDNDLLTSAPAQYAVYGSFPVDVIVYLHVQPSVLRFSCLPISRVECLLQLPSVDLVFSSKRAEDEHIDIPPSLSSKTKLVAPGKAVLTSSKLGHRRAGSDFRTSINVTNSSPLESSVGGLSMSGCLADFSLYIFHPYGGQKKSTVDMPSSLNKNNSNTSKLLSSRKDSLSLQVEFVKVNISRSRKLLYTLEHSSNFPKSSVPEKQYQNVNIKFSALCDIGSASFKYDMRRLTEILAFPRAWYRKAIWKRMFLGDETIRSTLFSDEDDDEDNEDEDQDNVSSSCSQSSGSSEDEGIDLTGKKIKIKKSNSNMRDKRHSLRLNLDGISQARGPPENWKNLAASSKSGNQSKLNTQNSNISGIQVMSAPWETLVLFGVNLSKLNIQMNMGNVMGNSTWLTRGFRSQGRVAIDSAGHKKFTIGLGLDGSALDAKGGIVGGIIEIANLDTSLNVREDRGSEPEHVLKIKLRSLQKRLDYMGTSVLMMRISDLDLTLKDEWQINNSHITKLSQASTSYESHPTKRPALVFIHGNLIWDQLQIMMSKSTTPDICKILAKLEEFFTQQFHSSKRVLSSLEPKSTSSSVSSGFQRTSSLKGKSGIKYNRSDSANQAAIDGTSTNILEARHHRHWQKALKLASGVNLSSLPNPLPVTGTILGGTVELTGKNISVACFYGINFRSKAWGLFSLRQPTISFATEAQELILDETSGLTDTHIIQNLSVSLGRCPTSMENPITAQHTTMATVCRMSRSVMFPPQFRHMHEWFAYAFATSDLDEVSRFPIIDFERSSDSVTTPTMSANSGDVLNTDLKVSRRISMSPKVQEFHHNKEVIFAFPSFQMELKTEHLQGPKTPTMDSNYKPVIDCTFVTDFDDHIFVAVDAESYFFLHELITSYIKERGDPKQAPSSPSSDSKQASFNAASSMSASRKSHSLEESLLSTDWREFVCHTWHLEPTVRLLSWAGKNIEPYGVDFILQRLGFSQARTTIPKWIQRGAMDPLDKILSLVMFRIIHANAIEPKPVLTTSNLTPNTNPAAATASNN